VTSVRGQALPAGAAGPLPGPRREYLLGLALGAVGAGAVLLSARQGWARVVTPAPAPLPASVVAVSGQDLVPLAGALALAALASLAAVIATRRLARRLAGLLMAVFGVVIVVAVSLPLATSDVLAAARVTAVSQAGSATAGGVAGISPGAAPGGGAAPGITAAGHVTMTAALWRPAAVAGALLIVAAGLLVAWRGPRWPVMSSRYDPPEQSGRQQPADSATLWDALSRGADPTDRAGGGAGQHSPD
jgi:uncharacterized membrane protein (TIGR02234 family)